MTVSPELSGSEGTRPRAGTALWLLVATAVALLLVAWTLGVARRGFNFDEKEHAHAVWLVSQGLRPFHDFFECHPPFPWFALAPLARGARSAFQLLLELRILASIANLATIVLCFANMRIGRSTIPVQWTCAGLLLAISGRPNLDYLVEFRPDSAATALLFLALLLFRTGRASAGFARFALLAFLGICSVFSSPKLLVFFALFAGIELLVLCSRDRGAAVRAAAALMTGGAAATALASGFLLVRGISPRIVYVFTIPYHELLARQAGADIGLWQSLLAQRFLVAIIGGGFACWLFLALSKGLRPNSFEISLAIFLVAQAALVPFPYKQYFAPWFLLAATFIHFWAPALARLSPRIATAASGAVMILSVLFGGVSALDFSGDDGAQRQALYWQFVSKRLSPGAHVVAAMPLHPILARDVCYGWRASHFGTYDSEGVARDLKVPGYSERFTTEWYERELEATPPDLIAVGATGDDILTEIQGRVVGDFVRHHSADYRAEWVGGQRLLFRRTTGVGDNR